MNKDEMDAAIIKSFDRCWGASDRTLLRASFVAGMLAAAELPGNANALGRDVIRATARKLAEGPQ